MQTVLNNKNISLLSFDPDGSQSSYTLHVIDKPIIQMLKQTLRKLEKIPQVCLCARGDCFQTQELHENFIERDLAKLFIVGSKAKYHLGNNSERDIKYFEENTAADDDIKNELKSLIKQCNEIVRSKSKSHSDIEGQISQECLDFILGQSQTNLKGWQIFFLSFLHNNGRPRDFKRSSPFLSLTYGYDKLRIARRFALERCKHNRGIVFIYSLNSNWPYYFRAKDLTAQLEGYGVRWYKDIHHEILLINGMYPHFLIGILEVSRRRTLKFILNPWIYKQFKQGRDFNYTEGVDIDQEKFSEFAQALGYRRWFFHVKGRQMEYISDFDTLKEKRIFRV